MSPGRLSWLHKIELVISNISSPKGGWVGEEEQGGGVEKLGWSHPASREWEFQREREEGDACGCDVNVPQNQIDGCPNPHWA